MKVAGDEVKAAAAAAAPMFPRLHVRDAERGGGPRAPPRNKMALYEQLTTPRFGPGGLGKDAAAAAAAGSGGSAQGGSRERSLFTPFYTDESPAQSTEVVQPHTLSAKNLRSARMELVRRSVGHANQRSSNGAASIAVNPYRLHGLSSARSACEEKVDDEDDCRVPIFTHSDIDHTNKDTPVTETKRLTPLHGNNPEKDFSTTLNSSVQFHGPYDKPLKQEIAIPKLRKHERNHNEHKSKGVVVTNSIMYSETGDGLLVTSPSASLDHEQTSTGSFIDKPFQRNTRVCLESCGNTAMHESGCLNVTNGSENGDTLLVRHGSCSKNSFRNSHRSLNMMEDYNCGSDDKVTEPVKHKNADGKDEVFESSMAESISGLEMSPDEIVGQIGSKQFWKARTAIVNQQRVFAVQVFELHRLIKVQKLIASSPHLLEEENQCQTEPLRRLNDENPHPDCSVKPQQQQTAKQKDVAEKVVKRTECRADNTIVPPVPSLNEGPSKRLHQLPRYEPSSGNAPPQIPMTPESNQPGWCYPPANHWLVPVMSPSEGLIYKPYPGPCSPPSGFVASAYGGPIPMSLPPVAGGFLNAAYSPPSFHQQQNMNVLPGVPVIAPNYIPMPYGLPFASPSASASVAEQANPVFRPRPIMQTEQGSRSSCNMAVPMGEAFYGAPQKVPKSKESELQGSTASSPYERAPAGGRGQLPLIPRSVAVEASAAPSQNHSGHHQTRLIKVVPHNKRSATESVARIFQAIQEERQQHEL